jgi:hypothetical protein
MSIRIGLYDFFAYTLPGIFYLLIAAYGLAVFQFVKVDLSTLDSLSLFSFLVVVGAGYITGLLLDPMAYRWARFFQGRNREAAKFAFEEFHSHHPWLELNFKPADWGILLRIIKSKSIEAAMDVEQHNVASIMLRNISLGLLLVSAIYLLFFFTVSTNIWNLILAGIFFSLSITAIRRSRLRRHWFYIAIFEAFAAHYLPQEKWIGNKRHITNSNNESESPGIEVSNSMSDSEAKPVESD